MFELKDFNNFSQLGCTHQARVIEDGHVTASAVVCRNSSWELEGVIGGSVCGIEVIKQEFKDRHISVPDWELDVEQPLSENGGQFDDGRFWK